MFGGDFPSNRRPYNNDRYNTNSATSEQMDPDDPESEDSECSELSARGQSAARKRNRKKRKKRKNNNNMDGDDQNINAGGRKVIVVDNQPDTHKCASFLALFLCPPIGIFAMYHSIMVTRCWDKSQEQSQEQENSNSSNVPQRQRQRQEELAQSHSTRTGLYAFFGMTLGLLFWISFYQYFQNNWLQYYFPPPSY